MVSYIPTCTDCWCFQSFFLCPSSHFSDGPWQDSHCTPSAMLNLVPRSSGLTFRAWQARQRSLVSGWAMFRAFAILEGLLPDLRLSLVRVAKDLKCLPP